MAGGDRRAVRIRAFREPFDPPRDTLAAVEEYGQELAPDDPSLADWHVSYVSNHAARIALDLAAISNHVGTTPRILEVGSIPLLLTTALSRAGYDVTGVDLAPERYASAIKRVGLNVARCDIEMEALPFEDRSFDVVIFNELLEHLRINPVFTLSQVARVIQPGGTLFLSTPNLKSLGGLRNLLLRDRAYSCSADIYTEYRKLEVLGHMGHVREYTVTEVADFLRHLGLVTEEIIYRGSYRGSVANLMIRVIPSLSPFVSFIATRDSQAQAGHSKSNSL